MTTNAKIRINLVTREIEIEGSEEFLQTYDEKLSQLLDRITNSPVIPVPAASEVPAEPQPTANPTETKSDVPKTFGELLHQVPKTATDADEVLIAAWYSQKNSADNTFKTGDANRLLTDQGVSLSNASQAVKSNVGQKRVFVVDKKKGKYRVSKAGEEHVAKLLGG